MEDAGILDGALLAVDRAAKPVNGSVVVVDANGEYTVKRLRRGPECVWLDPATRNTSPCPCRPVRNACVWRGEACHPHPAVGRAMGRSLRPDRLQQLLRLVRACLPARPGRQARHRAFQQRRKCNKPFERGKGLDTHG